VGVDGWCINSDINPNPYRSPIYTASLDAAMSLVPEGFTWRIMPADDEGHWLSEVWSIDNDGESEGHSRAATPALALTAAALRTIAETEGE
jgi:hypothetical protein